MQSTIKTNMKKQKHIQYNKGISLVIALIMMTFLLAIAFSIGNIILRQLRLTNIGTNSQTSFYAADSALECALYWDTITDGTVAGSLDQAVFGTSTTYIPSTNPIKCGVNIANPVSFTKTADTLIATTTFTIDYGQNTCAAVEVVKSEYRTKISTSGYNTGLSGVGNGCKLDNALLERVVERGLIFAH
jgi:Tfp pilus assembly protein PilX